MWGGVTPGRQSLELATVVLEVGGGGSVAAALIAGELEQAVALGRRQVGVVEDVRLQRSEPRERAAVLAQEMVGNKKGHPAGRLCTHEAVENDARRQSNYDGKVVDQ